MRKVGADFRLFLRTIKVRNTCYINNWIEKVSKFEIPRLLVPFNAYNVTVVCLHKNGPVTFLINFKVTLQSVLLEQYVISVTMNEVTEFCVRQSAEFPLLTYSVHSAFNSK